MLGVTACGRLDFGTVALVDGASDAAQTGLIARFPFDDAEGSGMLAAIPAERSVNCGDRCPSPSREHVVGAAATSFDGTRRVVLGDLIPAGPYSITVWLGPPTGMPFGSALGKPLDTTTVMNDVSLTVGLTVGFEGSRNGMIVGAEGPTDIRGGIHHVALIYDGLARTVVIDGVANPAADGPFETSSFPVAIGADLDANAFAFPYRGMMDDLRFYDHALAPAELEAIRAER